MAHGDAQRRGGELGPESTRFDEQVEEVVVGGVDVDAAQVVIDDAAFATLTETDGQALFEEIDTALVALAADDDAITGVHGVVLAAPLADSAVAASDVTVNADAGLSVAVIADSIYLLEAVLRFTAEVDGGCGVRVDFTVPANTTITGSSLNGSLFGDGTSVVALDTEVTEDDIGTSYEVKIVGQVATTDTAGNVGVSWAQKDSVDEDLTRKVGSYLKLTRIGANPA